MIGTELPLQQTVLAVQTTQIHTNDKIRTIAIAAMGITMLAKDAAHLIQATHPIKVLQESSKAL